MFEIQLVRKGVTVHSLSFRDGEITMDSSAAMKRALKCTLTDLPQDTDLLTDRLRVVEAETQKVVGVFLATTALRTVSAAGAVSYQVEAYDLTYLLQRTRTEKATDAYWPAGTKYTDCLEQILVTCGATDFTIVPSAAVLSTDRSDWEPGTCWLDIANQLLSEIGYMSIWFDSAGVCRIEPYKAPELRPVSHEYRAGTHSTILRTHTLRDDTFEAANVFTVLADGPDQEAPIWAQAVNDDPSSRLSIARRGRIVAPVAHLDGIADQAAAQAYADELKRRSMCSTELASIQTLPEAGHEMLDIAAIELPELSGKWEELAWTLPLQGGLMTHSIRRAVYV